MADDADRAGGLLERGEELGRIAGLLSEVAGGQGGLLAVEGPAGIGKTGLLDAAAEGGRARGLRVLRADGSGRGRARVGSSTDSRRSRR